MLAFEGLTLGTRGAGGNQLIISDGGRVDANWVLLGRFSGNNNSVLVTGTNSLLNLSPTGLLLVGFGGTGQQLTVSNGATVNTFETRVGSGTTASGSVLVTGQGSILRNTLRLSVGNNGVFTEGSGNVLVTDKGTIELKEMYAGTGGTISNRNGIYQFTTATPIVTPGAGVIMMTNGTVSYRDVIGANINDAQVNNITRQGNNTWRLNHSSNLVVTAYTFESVENTGNPLIYRTLAATNGSLWKAVSTTIGTNGLAVGGSTETFEFSQNFLIHSTNNLEFNLRTSTVLFSGLDHTNAITGRDLGGVEAGCYNNFSYGTLRLGSALAEVCFQSGDNAASNALYVTWLDLPTDPSLPWTHTSFWGRFTDCTGGGQQNSWFDP